MGFNPNRYFTSNENETSSFYLPNYNKLFILGGVKGDVNNSDTDHFDNSVILHEYGHFLENMFYTSDSPGGFHSGTTLLDPRLAWSEGWGNFIQAAVSGSPYYVDTFGNNNGFTQDIFRIDLEDQGIGTIDKPCPDCGPGNTYVEEGNFREFTITRALWDIIDIPNDGETITDGFEQIWATLTSNVKGFNETDFKFNSVGGFYERRDALMAASSQSPPAWTTLAALHDHFTDRRQFGQWVTEKVDGTNCTSSPYVLTPTDRLSNNVKVSSLNPGSEADSYIAFSANFFKFANYLHNNNFYHYKHPGGNLTLNLNYTTVAGTTNADLDLYLYKERFENQSYIIGDIDYLVVSDQGSTTPSGAFGSLQNETITVSNLSAGHYMINVNFFYDSPSSEFENTVNYDLKINTGSGEKYLCPSTFPN